MKGNAHAALVAGINSSLVAGWIRHRTRKEHQQTETPPSLHERVQNRAPLVAAGLGFTGLSTSIAGRFDSLELSMFEDQDAGLPLYQQMGNHRQVHSLPYIGSAVTTARVLQYGTKQFGEWLVDRLGLSAPVQSIIDAVDSLSSWVLKAVGSGAIGHLLSDIPTKGVGGSALKLLKPITDWNFCLQWVKSTNQTVNRYLTLAGTVLAGAAWSFVGLHIMSWEPPERKLQSFIDRISRCATASEAIELVIDDIKAIFEKVLNQSTHSIWESELFSNSAPEIRAEPESRWYEMEFDTAQLFDVQWSNSHSLHTTDPLPKDMQAVLHGTSLYSPEYLGVRDDDTSLFAESNDDGSTPLLSEDASSGISLANECDDSETPLFISEEETEESPSLYRSESDES